LFRRDLEILFCGTAIVTTSDSGPVYRKWGRVNFVLLQSVLEPVGHNRKPVETSIERRREHTAIPLIGNLFPEVALIVAVALLFKGIA
jgi:hypothetical protein